VVTLNLDIIIKNLDKIGDAVQKSLENVKSNGKSGGGASAVGIGSAVAILTKLLNSTDSVVKLLEIVGALINQLVAPFVPILLGLIKPVFVLLQKFLFGALAGLGVGGFGGEETIGTGEKIIKLALGIIAGAFAGIVAGLLGASVGWIIAIGAAFFLLVPILVDFGKQLGQSLIDAGKSISDFFTNGIVSVLQSIFDIFGIDLLEPLKTILNEVIDIFSGLIDIVLGVFTLDWELIKSGFIEVFSSLWEIMLTVWNLAGEVLGMIMSGAWEGLKSIWEWLLGAMKSGVSTFASLFIKGLNALIGLLNKIPGVNIGKVKSSNAVGDLKTTINVTVQGNTNDDTISQMLTALRREQNKRGTGSF